MGNTCVWFDIPVLDLSRAMNFYSKVLDIEMAEVDDGDKKMAFFPFGPGDVSGCLVQSKEGKPSLEGSVVYLNGGDDLSISLGKVPAAGGNVLAEKFSIGEHGFIAYFKDTEGNKVALHSRA